jgi:hypothetical protein
LESESYLRQSACTAVIIARQRAASQYKNGKMLISKAFFWKKGKTRKITILPLDKLQAMMYNANA